MLKNHSQMEWNGKENPKTPTQRGSKTSFLSNQMMSVGKCVFYNVK